VVQTVLSFVINDLCRFSSGTRVVLMVLSFVFNDLAICIGATLHAYWYRGV